MHFEFLQALKHIFPLSVNFMLCSELLNHGAALWTLTCVGLLMFCFKAILARIHTERSHLLQDNCILYGEGFFNYIFDF